MRALTLLSHRNRTQKLLFEVSHLVNLISLPKLEAFNYIDVAHSCSYLFSYTVTQLMCSQMFLKIIPYIV